MNLYILEVNKLLQKEGKQEKDFIKKKALPGENFPDSAFLSNYSAAFFLKSVLSIKLLQIPGEENSYPS